MAEVQLTIPSDDISLESSLEEKQGRDICVILHPHPLYGGNMDNNVVLTVKKGMNEMGWSTLRYNSRGLGKSGGAYDNGEGESRDLTHVVSYLQGKQPESRVHVAAYSFGAWVALKAMVEGGWTPESLLLVSPPVNFMSFEGLALPSVRCRIITGDTDDFCSLHTLKAWAGPALEKGEKVQVNVISRCDHFFWGRESELTSLVRRFVEEGSPHE